MVRDPIRRVLSHAAHVRAEPEMWLPEGWAGIDLPLADWIERHPLALFDNDQVRYLSGAAEFDGMALTSTMTEADLATALAAVRSQVFAAPMAAFDEALIAWAAHFGWRPPYYRRVNVRRRPMDSISERDRNAVEAWNRLDARLYEEVGVIFRQRVALMEREGGWTVAEEVARFRERNDTAAVRARLHVHTLRRGIRHPVRAGRSVLRQAGRRIG